MTYILMFFLGLTVLSLLPFLLKRLLKGKEFSKTLRFIVAGISVILFLLVGSSLIMKEYDLYWRGYKTAVFLLIGFNVAMVWMYVISNFKNYFYKVFIEITLFLVILISTAISVYNLMDYTSNLIYVDTSYRIEKSIGMMITADVLPSLYVKDGLLERKYHLFYEEKNFGFHRSEVESCEIIKQKNSYSVIFIMKDRTELKTKTYY